MSFLSHKFFPFLFSVALLTSQATVSRAQSLTSVPVCLNGAPVISSDGSTVGSCAGNEAAVWTSAAGFSQLGALANPGADIAMVTGLSANGAVAVGYSLGAGGSFEAFRWTSGPGMEGLGFLSGGAYSQAFGTSADGSVVVGISDNGITDEAFRWTSSGMVGLGSLGMNTRSQASAVSADGLVVVGYSFSGVTDEAFRWTSGGMVGLGSLGVNGRSEAFGTNADGSVVVGVSYNGTANEAFRWTAATDMVGMGFLGTGTYSRAMAVNGDGSVIVGVSDNGVTGEEAFRWQTGGAMESVLGMLSASGVDVTDWELRSASGVSADGNIIVGNGVFAGSYVNYLANIVTGGLTTPEDMIASLNTAAMAGRQAAAMGVQYLPQTLFVARNLSHIAVPVRSSKYALYQDAPQDIAPAAGGAMPFATADDLSFFVVGSYNTGSHHGTDNDQFNGILGISRKWTDDLSFGVGFIAGRSDTDFDFDSTSRLDATGGMFFAAYEPEAIGLRLYGTAYAAHLSMETDRGYMNGGALDFSKGDTDGTSYGVSAQIGWKEDIRQKASIMPFVEARYSRTNLDGYTEQNGAFASSFSKQTSDYTAALVGVEVAQSLSDSVNGHIRFAVGRRLSGEDGAITSNTSGLIQTLSAENESRNWGEAAVGGSWQAGPSMRFTTEVTGRTGNTGQPNGSIILGFSLGF